MPFSSENTIFLRHCLKTALFISAVILSGVLVWASWLLVPTIADPAEDFIVRKGGLVTVNETRRWFEGDSVYVELDLISSSGLEVALTLRLPERMDSPRPLVLFLGGQRTGRDALQLIDDGQGLVLAALSYSYSVEAGRSNLEVLSDLGKIQQAVLDAPPSVLLALDYLAGQLYVDNDRVELVGVSLGAFLMAAPAALDERVTRTWLIHGSAQPAEVFSHLMKDDIPLAPVRRLLARYFATVIASHHLKPESWVGRISPRPVILINARHDEMLPRASVERLHRAAREPVEHIWMEGQHIKPYRSDIISRLATEVLSRIAVEARIEQP